MRQKGGIKQRWISLHPNTPWHSLQERVSLALSCLQGLPMKLFLWLCSIHKRLSDLLRQWFADWKTANFMGTLQTK